MQHITNRDEASWVCAKATRHSNIMTAKLKTPAETDNYIDLVTFHSSKTPQRCISKYLNEDWEDHNRTGGVLRLKI